MKSLSPSNLGNGGWTRTNNLAINSHGEKGPPILTLGV